MHGTTMENRGSTCLYREARLNIESAYPGSTISFILPASTTSTFGSRTYPKRTVVTENHVDQDEDTFSKRHLASEASIFFRRHHQYPRSFLWRILDDRKALEIQSIDLDQDVNHKFEANLTLLLRFAAPIRPFGIAFAEPEDRDALTVFAITTANELYTITLHRDFFIKSSASEQDISDWCKRATPSVMAIRVPYRLAAVNVNELLVSLDDGAILHLTRRTKDDTTWLEVIYKQTNWSLGSLLTWKSPHTVRFENVDLDCSSAAAIALSPDRKHIISVGLDHRMRAWNVISGKQSIQSDLLTEPDQSNEKGAPYFIGPSQSRLLAVLDLPGGVDGAQYHVVTYSPKQHQFKFWGIRDADDADLGIFDLRSELAFIPPVEELMNTTVWTLEEFFINPGPAGWRGMELWIRARSGPSSQVYSLKFNLNDDPGKLADTWRYDWVAVDAGPQTVDGLRRNPANPIEQGSRTLELNNTISTEQWVDFLFYPGRFTTATLETALHVYCRGLGQDQLSRLPKKRSLKERLSATITAFATLEQHSPLEYEEYDDALRTQWEAYYGLVKDLHRRRGESLSLVFDHASDMPWLVLSDYISAVRSCSDPEVIALNAATLSAATRPAGPLRKALVNIETQEAPKLLNAAAAFRKSLPASFHHRFHHEVQNELLQSRSLSIIDRMELLEQNSDLTRQVSDEDLSLLVEELGMDMKELTTATFLGAIRTLGQEEQGQASGRKQITRYGLKALLRVSQETLQSNYDILLDLLVLILFMQFEEDLSEDFEAAEVFNEIINHLKDNIVLRWIAGTAWSHQSPIGPSSAVLMETLDRAFRNSGKFPLTQTVLEGIFGHRCFETPLPRGLKSELLTYWSRVWMGVVFPDGQSFDSSLDEVMMILLSQREYELALEFSKFLSEESWTTYLKGRMYIALGENSLASTYFQKSAYHLALGMFSIDDADELNFIPPDDRESFSDGLPRYYQHVLGLFEKVKAYSFVAEFAQLALRSFVGSEGEALRSELLSRLFNASIQTSKFDEAYSALTRHTDASLRRASLQTLITAMVRQQQTDSLVKFPFVGLVEDVDAILQHLCQTALLNITSGPPYHQILHAFRISRNDFRGAASALYDRLQRLKTTSSSVHDPAGESLIQCYLMIINTLSSVGKEEAYILAEQRVEDGPGPQILGIGQGKKLLKRQVVTLDTLRKDYQAELDRVAAIESGQYPFVAGSDEMDIL
ncbi:hypothetical protein CC78DRAFT_491191 [Lojkania enalia]|uniref:Nucleoporin n=1 Tax=Lojkania enalia TaxID=147567 RepID=A0A9P4KFM4_9PLEO|nr:hypothetical protein CC78DRAFT_491191 [Didymosphaeria enalia]